MSKKKRKEKPVQIRVESRRIVVELPITGHTSKVRLKRSNGANVLSQPVAARREILAADDYLEWQISYETENKHAATALPDLEVMKTIRGKKQKRFGFELIRLIHEARTLSLLTPEEWKELLEMVKLPVESGVADEPVSVSSAARLGPLSEKYGFERFHHKAPDYVKRAGKYSVEIKIAPRQRAVGNQAMVFVHLPVSQCSSRTEMPLVGRKAIANETVDYTLDSTNTELLKDTVCAFAFASKVHRNDLHQLFEGLEKL